jgi:hypothetical protein
VAAEALPKALPTKTTAQTNKNFIPFIEHLDDAVKEWLNILGCSLEKSPGTGRASRIGTGPRRGGRADTQTVGAKVGKP